MNRLSYKTDFYAGVFTAGKLKMCCFHLKLWLFTDSVDSDEQNIAFDRIRFFIDNILTNTVFVEDDRVEQCRKLSSANISITSLPSLPVEQVIGLILHTKFNAITEGRMSVVDTEISSSLSERVTYLHGEEELPGVSELDGWWHRADMSHCDDALLSNANERVVSLKKVRTWREVGLAWESDDLVFEPTSNTVVFLKDE